MAEQIQEQNILDAYIEDMVIAAISTNRRQNVPDAKDGLKSVVRRILTAMFFDKHLYYNSPYSKCAGVIGTVLEKYHPHGDSSVYDAMIAVATWWNVKMPLIDGHGNYGNMQGDGAAAYRYTECRLSQFAQECVIGELADSKDAVDWTNNFNDSLLEPEYLACRVPLLLINGTLGIGIGLKTEIPRHNVSEVIDATINLIKNPNAPVVLIPDHCMPVKLVDTNWKAICNSGHGNYKAKAIIDIEVKNDIPYLIIKSIPDRVILYNKGDGVIDKIWDMVKDKKLPQIRDIKDETDGEDLRYVIELQKGSDPHYVRDYLYKHTLLCSPCTVNFETIDGINPVRFSYKSYLQFFIEFRKTIKFRTYCSLYQRDKTKLNQKTLYIRLMQNSDIDKIISEIRHMKKVDAEARNKFMESLIKRFNVSDLEARFIMEMDTMKLAIGYLPIYEKEAAELTANCEYYLERISNEKLIEQEIIDELMEYKAKYGRPRTSIVVSEKDESDIPKGEFRIVITENNFIKKIGVNDNINSIRGDSPKYTLVADNRENILLFDKKGKVFKLPVFKVPLTDKNSAGFDIRILCKNCTSDIAAVMYEPVVLNLAQDIDKKYLIVVTENNSIKKMGLDDFVNVALSGTTYTKLSNGDSVVGITIGSNKEDAIIYSDHKALRVNVGDIPHYKRTALGVAAMNTPDKIDGLSLVFDKTTDVVVITKSGRVNRFNIAGMPVAKRNRSGSSVIKLGKQDSILAIYGLNKNDSVRLVSSTDVKDIKVSDFVEASSVSAGNKVSGDVIKAYPIFS